MRIARVKEINDGEARLTCLDTGRCENCESLACPAEEGDKTELVAKVPENVDVSPGDTVEVESVREILWESGAILFVLPVTSLLVGIFAGYGLTKMYSLPLAPELAGTVLGLVLLLLTIPLIRYLGRNLVKTKNVIKIKK